MRHRAWALVPRRYHRIGTGRSTAQSRFNLVLGLNLDAPGSQFPPHGLKLRGYPCLAIVKILNARDRMRGTPDIELIFDGDESP